MDGLSHPHVDAQRMAALRIDQQRMAALLGHARWIEELAHRLVRDQASAEDLAQAAWVRALRTEALPRTNVRGWLGRVVRNLARESHRREAQRTHVERRGARPEALPSSAELVVRADAEKKLVEAVLALEEPHRQLLLLRYFEGLSAEEIARREGASVSTVANRLTRAHASLRERLERAGGGSWLAAIAPIVAPSSTLHPEPSTAAHPEIVRSAPGASSSSAVLPRTILMSTLTKVIVSVVGVAAVVAWIIRRPSGPVVAETPPPLVEERSRADTTPSATSPSERVALAANPDTRDAAAKATESAPLTLAVGGPLTVPPPAKTARIHGRVFRPDGELAAARKVRLFRTPRGPQIFATSDEHGSFDAKELLAGKWAVSSVPDAAERKMLGLAPDPTQSEFLSQKTVELADGADVEIELGAPPKNPIRVSGRFVGAEPAPEALVPAFEALVHWVPEGEDGLDRAKYTRSLAGGTYSVVLESPGPYLVSAILPGPVRVEHIVDIPDKRAFEHDIAVPRGVIRGQVHTPDGIPVRKASVNLTPRAGHRPFMFQASFAFQRTTDGEGRFEFGFLQPGTYAVSVSGGNIKGRSPEAGVMNGVVVTSERSPDELDIVIGLGLIVRGHVSARGSESPYYTNLFVFDASGEPVNPLSAAVSDKDGEFELPALGAGRYSVVGAHGNDWTLPVAFEIRDGEPAPTVELKLQPAATLVVEGTNLGDAWIDVRDANGNCFSALLDKNLFNGSITRACLVDRWRFLVPDGNYEVRARSTNGIVATGRAAVVAGEPRIVRLVP